MYNYLSLPIKNFRENIQITISKDLNKSFKVYTYVNQYNSDLVTGCKIFYICLPNNSFNMDFCKLEKLSPGCYRELKLAIRLNKEIKIIYKTISGNIYKEYNTEISSTSITGVRNSKQFTNIPKLIQPQTILLLNV